MTKIAESICRLDVILKKTDLASDKLRLRLPPAIVNFLSYMNEVDREAEVFLNENIQSTRVKLGTQKGTSRIQDNMDLTKLKSDSFDVNNCPYCKHKYVAPIGLDIVEITTYNTKIAKTHLEKMKIWSNTPVKKRE